MLPALQTQERAQQQAALRSKLAAPAKNRGRLDVVADVLEACSANATKNAVLIRANLNSVTATYLLAQLIETRLVDTVVDEEGRVSYITTKQGAAYLDSYRGLVGMLTPALVPDTKAREEVGRFL
jgi:predicted transcriptional regulator